MMRCKRITAMVFAILLCISVFCIPVQAKYYYQKDYNYTEYGFLWLTRTNYNMKVYSEPGWWRCYYGNNQVSTGFDRMVSGHGSLTLSQTKGFSVSRQDKFSWNTGVDFSGYGVPAYLGIGGDHTVARQWSVSSIGERTIPSSAPSGYYSYNVCQDEYRVRVDKYKKGSSQKISSLYFFTPKNSPYRSIIYNPHSASYSGSIQY